MEMIIGYIISTVAIKKTILDVFLNVCPFFNVLKTNNSHFQNIDDQIKFCTIYNSSSLFITSLIVALTILFIIFIWRLFKQKRRINILTGNVISDNMQKQMLFKEQQKQKELSDKFINLQEDYKSKENHCTILEEELQKSTSQIKIQDKKIKALQRIIEQNIDYASYIQSSLIPEKEYLNVLFPKHFVFYKPSHEISGDFYWTRKIGRKIYIATGDCTGYDVNGGLMSILSIAFLNDIVLSANTKQENESLNMDDKYFAGSILNEFRERIKRSSIHQDSQANFFDTIQMSLCIIDEDTQLLQYAGAYLPIVVFKRNGLISGTLKAEGEDKVKTFSISGTDPQQSNAPELIEFKPDRSPLGHYKKEKAFSNAEIKVEDGDIVYLFTNGYINQTGGKQNRKFNRNNFRELIQKICQYPMLRQKEILRDIFYEWMYEGDESEKIKQVDDVLVSGMKLAFHKHPEFESKVFNWENKTVLIAEDESINFSIIKEILKKTKINILWAQNGLEAFNIFKEKQDVSIILMDIRMPVLNGYEAIRKIREMNKITPIIIVTAYTESGEKEMGQKVGSNYFITKPIDESELLLAMHTHLN